VRPYTLRHTFAIESLLDGATLTEVQSLLGHRSEDTTRKFYAPIMVALLRPIVERRSINLWKDATAPAGLLPEPAPTQDRSEPELISQSFSPRVGDPMVNNS
jgi:hypothetical protein